MEPTDHGLRWKELEEMFRYAGRDSHCGNVVLHKNHLYSHLVNSHYIGFCKSFVTFDYDVDRIPRYIAKYSCGHCNHQRCSDRGDFRCQEVHVQILTYFIKKGKFVSENIPVGCVCASTPSTLIQERKHSISI